MKYVASLLEIEITVLEYHYQHGTNHRERQRCQALLLSNKGHNIKMLSELFSVDRDTIHSWIKRWENSKGEASARLLSLSDAPRSGRPSQLDDTQKKS
jgi:transposase